MDKNKVRAEWITVTERLPEEHDSLFAKFKGTPQWSVVWIFCYDMERKDRLTIILGEPIFLGLISSGIYLMA